MALASGFDSLRRFNAAFVERYRFNPTQLRRQRADGTPGDRPGRDTALRLAYRPPYDVEAVIGFFARRQVRGVEQVDGLALRRTLGLPGRDPNLGQRIAGWLECRFVPERCEVHVVTSQSLAPVLGAVLQRVRLALDLDADPSLIDPVLATLPVPSRPGRAPAQRHGCV